MTPYSKPIEETKQVMDGLIKLMCACEDMKLFKNIAAVYVVWQHEASNLQSEQINWQTRQV